jgi:hypothetical protein
MNFLFGTGLGGLLFVATNVAVATVDATVVASCLGVGA